MMRAAEFAFLLFCVYDNLNVSHANSRRCFDAVRVLRFCLFVSFLFDVAYGSWDALTIAVFVLWHVGSVMCIILIMTLGTRCRETALQRALFYVFVSTTCRLQVVCVNHSRCVLLS